MSDRHLDPHLQAEHTAPDRTTPQGLQDRGREHGHEGRDVIFRPLMVWFIGLQIGLGLTLWLLRATFGLWDTGEDRRRQLPPPQFAERREPPAPRILPNPIDSGINPMERVQEYPETIPEEREQEVEAMEKIGLRDEKTGLPRLPQNALSAVAGQGASPPGGAGGGMAGSADGAASQRPSAPMPSDSSGGTRTEDRLR